ncbi:SDR family NAD(P)-dependent oxidoreductase (plasmid) [Rathayibacter sp. VKM Ac-2803]|uniref:Short-chain dehydrogenase n=1 Tax=Rathayibacter caricis DSM 15933 TaxID=1328867 RepID=A0A2T4UNT2_9MICO|nr:MULTISPECIES: SDR family oxidoreductase [Rathayibacter]MWV51352.1 SDR family NAD(P)-dependent oxidoreductase [Rathayibacter sp. VKM Ac-2803]PTL71189.1 short-chain dehydrogenase [Rathayibacter caricis DSM 15933]
MRHPLHGQIVLVTGGGSGIGRLLALGAARRGAEVVIWDLSEATAAGVAAEITGRGHRARAAAVDVSDRAAVEVAAQDAGPIDVLINNAGVVTGKDLLDASDEAIERTFRVNTLALFWTTRAFLPGMMARDRGTVVTISSAAGLVGVARQTDYSASKFAAFGFAESLRVELAKKRARVNSLVVCPYYIDTGMFDGVKTKFPLVLPILKPENVAERILASVERGNSRLVMPRLLHALPVLRVFPVRGFDTVMRFLGVNSTMDYFVGRARP